MIESTQKPNGKAKKNNYDFLKKSQIYNKKNSKQNRNVQVAQRVEHDKLLVGEKSMSKAPYHFIESGSGMSADTMLHQIGHKVQVERW